MQHRKPSEQIAARFQISRESATYFLGRVQKRFKIEKPPQQLIVDFMDRETYTALPKPHQVAKQMSEAGLWQYPLHAESDEPQDEEDMLPRE